MEQLSHKPRCVIHFRSTVRLVHLVLTGIAYFPSHTFGRGWILVTTCYATGQYTFTLKVKMTKRTKVIFIVGGLDGRYRTLDNWTIHSFGYKVNRKDGAMPG